MNRRFFLAATAASVALAGATQEAWAAYPDRTIRYIVHVSPGSATDIMARKISSILQKQLHIPVVVENRPGGRGASEMAELTRSRPDGYTIAAATSTHLAEFHETLTMYNINSVDWLTRLVTEPFIFVVSAKSPIKSMQDLAAYIKAHPRKVVVSGFVKGSGENIAWEMFMETAHLPSDDVSWVPYDGVEDGVTAVLGGHGLATVAFYGLVKDQVATGHLRIVGVMADKRLTDLPNVPTLREQGFDVPGDWSQWRGIFVPKGTPTQIQDKLAAEIKTAMQSPSMKQFMEDESVEYDYAGPAKFTAFIERQDKLTVYWLKKLGFIK